MSFPEGSEKVTEEEWTLPQALKDLTDAIRSIPDPKPQLEALSLEVSRTRQTLEKISDMWISSARQESEATRQLITTLVQEILKAMGEEMQKSRVKEKIV